MPTPKGKATDIPAKEIDAERRMFEALGTEVLDLQRIRIGNVLLNNLLIGKSQKIEKGELEKLLKKIKIEK